jgi:hypothetical protein
MPMSRAVSGADNSDVAPRRPRVGLGRHGADGLVAHLMAWDRSELGRVPIDRVLCGRESLPGRFTYGDESCRRAAHLSAA